MTLEEQVNDFCMHAKVGNSKAVADRTLQMIVRVTERRLSPYLVTFTVLEIAGIRAFPPGKGRFQSFLTWLEARRPFGGVYINGVDTARFADFWRKRGDWTEQSLKLPSFYKVWWATPTPTKRLEELDRPESLDTPFRTPREAADYLTYIAKRG